MSRRIKLIIQYDGSAYNGWQIQPSGVTIQGLLQESLFRVTGEKVSITAAGRTDAGVHAIEQVAMFDSVSVLGADVIKKAANAVLPPDIRVVDAGDAEGRFHPRYDATGKRYTYVIANMRDIPPFIHKYVWCFKIPLDLGAMKSASACLLGKHDFSSFRGSGCGSRSPVKEIHAIEVEKADSMPFLFTQFRGNFIILSIEADAFLRHMARNIVGTVTEVGRGRMSPDRIKEILKSKDRKLAGPAAPPCGLFLEKVFYD